MKSIYGSKLFIASKRKEQIKAALLSTANEGLVQQLAEDLDEQYQIPENLGQEKSASKDAPEEEVNKFDEFSVDEEIDPENDLVRMDDFNTHSEAPKPVSPSGPPSEHNEDLHPDKPDADTSELIPESPANEKPAPEPEASTQVSEKELIKASSIVDKLNTF